MFTAIGVEQGNVVTEDLNAWFDFGNTECYLPAQGTGSITAGTLFYNLAPNQSHISGTINGAVNWSPAFGGCMNLTNRDTSTLQYTAGLSASFTTQVIVTPGTDALPNNNWIPDAGGWPSFRPANNGFILAQGFGTGTPTTGNFLIPVLGYSTSFVTLSTATIQPAAGWNDYARFPNVYSFKTNGSNSHSTYMNVGFKATDTSTRTRGNSPVGTVYMNFDSAIANRHGLGRIVAFLHYNRELSDAEIFQNAQFYLNRFGTK